MQADTESPPAPEFRFPSQAEIERDLRDCGFQHLIVFYDDSIQSDVVKIEDNQVNDEQLRCAYHAQIDTPYYLEWEPSVVGRFYGISEQLFAPRAKAAATAYFAARPHFGPVPVRIDNQTALDFARAIERFCGPDAAGFFTDRYGGIAASPERILAMDYETSIRVLGCVSNAAILRDFPFGFIGNERELSESGGEE